MADPTRVASANDKKVPANDAKILVPGADIHQLIETVLVENGASQEEAAAQAAQLTEADLRAQHSHGVQRLRVLVGRMRSGMLQPKLEADCHWATESVLQVDGRRGFGPAVAFGAIDAISSQARRSGMAMALIRNSNHLGMLAPYVEHIAEKGQIGIALTTSEALVHPWGGSKALIGTNPLAIGVPAHNGCLSLDMSTSAVSAGKILSYAGRNEAIPHGWAVDSTGRSTTDAASALSGALSPFGGAKGYALGLALEVLVAAVTDTATGTDVHGTLDTDQLAPTGDVLVCISPDAFGIDDVSDRIGAYLQTVRDSERTDPGVAISVPGDRARASRAKSLVEGVWLSRAVWDEASSYLKPAPTEERSFS
jgi:L-2-hydroxycarboxylate dehydrogenase (NAD+)